MFKSRLVRSLERLKGDYKTTRLQDIIIEPVVDFFHRIIQEIRSIYYSIYNIIRWVPILWKDRDWDQEYLLDILKFKLENMEEFFSSDRAWTENAPNEAKDMRYTIDMIDKITNFDYEIDYINKFDSDNPEYMKESLKFTKGTNSTKSEHHKKLDKEFLSIMKIASARRDSDKQKLFKFISDHIDNWWD